MSATETMKTAMMRRSGEYAAAGSDELACSVLKMPYAGGRLHMLLFLPEAPEEFAAMEDKFASFDFASALAFAAAASSSSSFFSAAVFSAAACWARFWG